jgi:malate dehydrogenase
MALISIIGAGRVGSTAAFAIALKGLGDIRLVDVVENVPQGESLDMMHAAHSGFSVDVTGSNDFKDISGSDVVINTAGIARKPGMDRLDLLNKNKGIVSSVAEKIKEFAPGAVVVQVSNPMDVMNFVMNTVPASLGSGWLAWEAFWMPRDSHCFWGRS